MRNLGGRAPGRHILVDIRICQVNRERGIPVYAQNLLQELPSAMPGTAFTVWHDPTLRPPTQAEALKRSLGPFRSSRELAELPRESRFTDLLTACLFQRSEGPLVDHLLPPWLRAHQPRRLGIVYDLIPYLFQGRYLTDPLERGHYLEAMRCLRQWDHLFAISECTRRDAIRHAGVEPSRIHTIYAGLDPAKERSAQSGGTPWGGRLPASYAVYVSGDDWRKNTEGSLRGFARYRQRGGRIRGLALVCAMSDARRRECLQVAAEAGLAAEDVVITGKVDDAELMGLVRGADLSLYPSFYEGLGLPVLESYACGVPVLASDRSSLPELVPASCCFDPDRPEAMAEAMLAFEQDPTRRETSLAQGKDILAVFTWSGCARRLAEACADRKEQPEFGRAVAAVAVLPPARTGIAPINAHHLRLTSAPLHMFSAFPRAKDRLAFRTHAWARLDHPRLLPRMQQVEKYSQRLYVLGNSSHHQATLDALRAMREAPGQTWLYLHDGDLLGLWQEDFKQDLQGAWALYRRSYPDWRGRAEDLLSPDRPRGFRPLLDLGTDVGIIVNSLAAREQVLRDLGTAPALGIHTLFLPVEPHPPRGRRLSDGILRVGTFGKPERAKQLDRIVASLERLARRQPVQLLVAGFDAGAFLAREGLLRPGLVEVLDNPTDEALLEAMRSVDLAVQLRFPSHGEASGVVSHLLGMGVPIVATDTGGFSELGEAAILVPPDISPDRLAEAMLRAPGDAELRASASAFRAAHLPEAFVQALDDLLRAHRPS